MSKYKKQILDLRSKGKTYIEISQIVGCAKSTVTYYCGDNQKEKVCKRTQKRRNKHPYVKKRESFLSSTKQPIKKSPTLKTKKLIQLKIETFHLLPGQLNMYIKPVFTVQDVIDKFGKNPQCYLTGKLIDINKPRTYQFDHIIPRSRGGDNSIDNLAICSKEANQAKRNMTPDEFINLCKQVLKHNGYQVSDGKGN